MVDHGKSERAFGANPTPHREAIRQTLDCLRQDTGRLWRRKAAEQAFAPDLADRRLLQVPTRIVVSFSPHNPLSGRVPAMRGC